MPDILIVYASKHGQTARIASHIADTLRDGGATVVVSDVASGANHEPALVAWAKAHAVTLNEMPSAFFSVSLSAAEDTDESRAGTREYIDDFLDDTGWTPRRTEAIAGALQYREYDFATRVLMRLIMRRGEHPTDWSRDYEYTDWDAVDRFARECAAMAEARAGAPR